jgi:hypothetical protein
VAGFAILPVIDLQSNQPRPAAAMAMSDDGEEPKQYWPDATAQWLAKMKQTFDESICLDQRRRNLDRTPMVHGSYPSWANAKIEGRTDPYGANHWGHYHDAGGGGVRILRMEDFCRPDLLFFVPELRWPDLYRQGRPKCKWCMTEDCVQIKGSTKEPHHCYDTNGVTALWGKKYLCSRRDVTRPTKVLNGFVVTILLLLLSPIPM